VKAHKKDTSKTESFGGQSWELVIEGDVA
jgi:hypothetical protein